jgi:CRP-like cAMP-binding protein/class 3 adenylate cyclase
VDPAAVFPEPNDRQPASKTESASLASSDQDGSERKVTVSFTVKLKQSGRVVRARRERMKPPPNPTIIERIVGWLCRPFPPSAMKTAQRRDVGPARPAVVSRPPAISFWDALDLAEREALAAVAVSQAFTVGESLMREGDLADCVMVIIEGHAEVCVYENGWERVLAERGPGELVGERGGLQVQVRSATVIALDAMRVLTVRTEDFQAFVNNHPAVFDMVEQQLYDRLTEAPVRHRDRIRPADAYVMPGITRPAVIHPGIRPITEGAMSPLPPLNGEICTILYSDVVGFSSADRNDADRLVIRRTLFGITRRILQGIPGAWSQDRGDGLLTVIPPGVPTADVIALLHRKLPSALDRHNRTDRRATRFQLRIAVDVGPVTSDTMGVSGETIIIAARLLEAAAFKSAFAASTATFGLIASRFVFEAVIRHSPNPLDLAGYSQVPVEVKGLTTLAWMKLFAASVPPPITYRSAAPHSFGAQLAASAACNNLSRRTLVPPIGARY